MNQLVFNMELSSHSLFQWIKKPAPLTPADYRPPSMLEVLRILAKQLTMVLPEIIGDHQHCFMAGKGIQELPLLVTHLIQDTPNDHYSS
jgi:hypothetical protein